MTRSAPAEPKNRSRRRKAAPKREPLSPSAPDGLSGLVIRAYPGDLAAGLRPLVPLTRGSSHPALRGVLLEGDRFGLRASASDIKAHQTRPIPGAVVCSEGAALVPADRLTAVLDALEPEEPVTIWTEGEDVCIGQGGRVATVPALQVENFPRPGPDGEDLGTFSGTALAGALERLAPLAGADPRRPILTTVALGTEVGSREVTLAATDSYRLGLCKLEIPEAARTSAMLAIPAKQARRLTRDLRASSRVAIRASAEQVSFRTEAAKWWIRLEQGEYPSWDRLIPRPEGRAMVELDSTELEAAIRRAAAVATKTDPLRILASGTVTLRVRSRFGEYEEVLASAIHEGAEREVAYTPSYLAAGLAFAASERVRLSIPVENPDGPTMITGQGEGIYLLMPVRIPGTVR